MEVIETHTGKYFAVATKEVKPLADGLIIQYHPDLDSAAVKFDFLFIFRDVEGEAPALEEKGQRIFGKVNILPLKDRVKGNGDAELIIDGDEWPDLTNEVKKALVDHLLCSLEVKRDKDGSMKYDDLERPLLRIRPHDRVIKFFDAVAQRHGVNSYEVNQVKRLFREAGQTYLPFIDGPRPQLKIVRPNHESND